MKGSGSERMREFTAQATFTPAATEPVPHAAAQARARIHTPDDNLVTQQQHATARHFCIHSITAPLITCKLISRCPRVTSITLSYTHTQRKNKTKSTMLLNFLCSAALKMCVKCSTFWRPTSEKFSFAITPLVINRVRNWPALVRVF